MQKEEFLLQYNISIADLEEAKIGWNELELIVKEYEKVDETLHVLGKEFIDEYLYDIERAGDTKIYDSNEIEIISDGIYRSLHYIIKYKGYYVEIQGRTLFEEGWSEIDHDIVYPYNTDDERLKDFSTLLNRLSGMADEMSSYFRRMKEERL